MPGGTGVGEAVRPSLLLALVFLFPAPARAQTVIWEADNLGYARQVSVAATDTHLFLAEAYSITTIELATGASSFVRTDGYLPVQASAIEGDVVYLAMGYVESGTPPLIASFRAGEPGITTLATLTVSPRAIAVSGGEVFFTTTGSEVYRARGGRAVRLARPTPPLAIHGGLAVTDAHVYFLVIDSDAGYQRTLVRVPRGGGAIERLTVVSGDEVALRGRQIVITGLYAPGAMSLYDVDTGALTSLPGTETVAAVATRGSELVWATGNFYSGDTVALRRLSATGPTDVFTTDRRLVEALASNAAGYYLLLGGHPDGECHEEHRGCGENPMPPETVCTAPDHRLWFIPR